MSAVTCLRARDRQESGYKGPALAMQLLLYPETALPFTTKAGSENCTGYYLETSGVLLFAWNMLPQGQVCAWSCITFRVYCRFLSCCSNLSALVACLLSLVCAWLARLVT